MWIGWVQSPLRFIRIHSSTLFCCTVNLNVLQSMNWPLMDHWPVKRSNLKVRMAVGTKSVLVSEENFCCDGGRLLSTTFPPATRNCISRLPPPAGTDDSGEWPRT